MSLTKACLVFTKSNFVVQEKITLSAQKAGLLTEIAGLQENAEELANKRTKLAVLETRLANLENSSVFQGVEDNESDILQFQFNPSTLRISAYGGGMQPIYNFAKDSDGDGKRDGDAQIAYGPIQENITVDFKVIFDAEHNTDAFMIDKLNLSETSAVKSALDIKSQDVYSVRQIVEGFLAVIRHHEQRKVTFAWGPMNYTGNMNAVQCAYTMFNPSGEPIRAEVTIRILACEVEDTGKWGDRYDELLGKVAGKEGSDWSGKANNLINLQL